MTESIEVIEPAPPRRAKMLAITAGAVAVMLVLGVGAYLGYRLVFGGAQPSERMPASTVAFLSVDLTPGAEQSARLLQLLKKFPGYGGDTDPKAAIERLLEKTELKNVDIKRDITSWVGTRLAVGAWTDPAGVTYALIAIASEDDKAAAAGLARVRESAGDEFGFVVRDGYALIAAGAKLAQAAAEAASAESAKAPLSDDAKFAEARRGLADDQIALLYFDLDQIAKLAKAMARTLGDSLLPDESSLGEAMPGEDEFFEQMSDELSELYSGRVIAGARIEEDAVVVKMRTFGGKPDAAPAVSDALARLGQMPSGTEIAAVASLPDDLETSSLASFAMPMVFGSLLSQPPVFTAEQEREIDELLAKEKLTEAEEKRLDELFMGSGGDSGEAAIEAFTETLSGATIAFAMTDVMGNSRLKAVVALAAAPSPERVEELTSLSSEEFSVTVDGSTVTATSAGFPASGSLSADPLFQRAVAGAPANLKAAIYADLEAAGKQLRPLRAVAVMSGAEQGQQVAIARVLFG